MLKNIHVKSFALIDEVEINLASGLNILTGETGAGKSIIIDAVNFALGQRVSKDVVRDDAEYALSELVFEINDDKTKERLNQFDIPLDDNEVLIQRKITNGKSTARINGETVTLSTLKLIAAGLIDIHGQHDNQSLLSKASQQNLLDTILSDELKELLIRMKDTYVNLNNKISEYEQLNTKEAEKEIAFLQYELNEIDSASLHEGEDEALESDYKKMNNSKRIADLVSGAHRITGYDSEGAGSLIGRALSMIRQASSIDDDAKDLELILNDIDGLLNDFNRSIADYEMSLDFSDEDYKNTEDRLNLINSLKNKYGKSIKEILDKAVEDKRISSSTRDRILGLYADGKVNVADAQAFRSLSSYRAVLDMAGRWTDKMDRALERMKDGEFTDEDFETIFQTIKPFVYTQTTKSTGVENTKDYGEYLKVPMQCKNSEFLLINALNTMVFALSNSGKLKAIEQFMEDYNVDVVQFESAVKCGGQGKLDLSTLSDSDYDGVYDYLKETTGFNVDSENGNSDYVTIIDYEDYGIQTENPEHLSELHL